MLEVQNISRKFSHNHVLKDISFSLTKKEILGIEGQNGVGKTTLLRILSTAILPSTGNYIFQGLNVLQTPQKVRGNIGMMPSTQKSFFDRLNGLENLTFFASLQGVSKRQLIENIKPFEALSPFQKALSTPFFLCSSGMKQILIFARAFIHQPKLILLDEPFKSLDQQNQEFIFDYIKSYIETNQSSIIVTSHQAQHLEKLATRTLKLSDGVLC